MFNCTKGKYLTWIKCENAEAKGILRTLVHLKGDTDYAANGRRKLYYLHLKIQVACNVTLCKLVNSY
jgi:hypothetical protein